MAGHGALRTDPALERYYALNKNRWRYFRWTPRNAMITFIYAGLIPAVTAYAFYRTDGKYYMRAKMRGDVIKEW